MHIFRNNLKVETNLTEMSGPTEKDETENQLDSSVDFEAALKEYLHDMPPELQNSEYCHVSIFYADKDRERVLPFKEHLEKEIDLEEDGKVIVMLYDGPEFESLTNSKLSHIASVVERSTFQFMFMTRNFVEDKWMELCSDSLLMNTLYDDKKKWSVVPVDTEELSKCTFKYPIGLNTLKGVAYHKNDEFYRGKLKRPIKDRAQTRINRMVHHKIKQRKWIEKHMCNGQPRKVKAVTEELQHLEIKKCQKNKTEGRVTPGELPALQHSQCDNLLNENDQPPVLNSDGSLQNSGLVSTGLEEDCGDVQSEHPSFRSKTSETKFQRLHSPSLAEERNDNSEQAENKREDHISRGERKTVIQTVNVYNAKSVQIGDQNMVKVYGIEGDRDVVKIPDQEPSYESAEDEPRPKTEDLTEYNSLVPNVTLMDRKQQQGQSYQRLFTEDESLLSAKKGKPDKEDLCVVTEPVKQSGGNSDGLGNLPNFKNLMSKEPKSENGIKTPENADKIHTDFDLLVVKERGDIRQSANPKAGVDECQAATFDTPGNTQNTYILNSVYHKRKINPIGLFFSGGIDVQFRGCDMSDVDTLHVD